MRGNLRLSNFLTNMRWPFLAVSIIVVGLEIANSALRASRASTLSVLVYICAAVYVVIAASMSAFFIYTGSRVVAQQLRAASLKDSSTGAKSKRKNRVKWTFKAVRYILAATGFLVLYCVSIIFLAINVRSLIFFSSWSQNLNFVVRRASFGIPLDTTLPGR
jgi:membrane protein insertase Oxa1/YidC/SpoIIIJ